jgi:hypothetical protein
MGVLSPLPRLSTHHLDESAENEQIACPHGQYVVGLLRFNFFPHARVSIAMPSNVIIPLRYFPLTLAIAKIGFINSDDEWAQYGVRYLISPEPKGSSYRIGRPYSSTTKSIGTSK